MSDERLTSQGLVKYLETEKMADEKRLDAAREWAKSNPNAPGSEIVVQFLEATGSGVERVQRVRDFAAKDKTATVEQTLDYMINNAFQQGTIEKVGRFLRGPTYVHRPDGITEADRNEVNNVRRENAELRRQLSEASAELIVERKKNTQLEQRLVVFGQQSLPEQIRQSEQLGVGRKRETALAGAK